MTKERIQKWDILKLFLIFLVVLGHFAEYFTNKFPAMLCISLFIYTFHMPLFLFVSGLFSKRTIDEKRYDKIFSFLILYLLIKTINFVCQCLSSGIVSFSLLTEKGVPWYAFAIFAFCIITVQTRKISPIYVLFFSIILSCLVGYDNKIGDYLMLSRLFVFYPFFFAGYCLDANKVNNFISQKKIKIISVFILITFVCVIVFFSDSIKSLQPLLSGRNPYSTLNFDERKYGFFIRFLYYAVVALIGASVISLTPQKTPKGILADLGSRSLQVYALHYIVIYFLFDKLKLNEVLLTIPKGSALVIPLSAVLVLLFSMKFWALFFNSVLYPKKIKELKK